MLRALKLETNVIQQHHDGDSNTTSIAGTTVAPAAASCCFTWLWWRLVKAPRKRIRERNCVKK